MAMIQKIIRRELTDKQKSFVEYFVTYCSNQTEAARAAGYPAPRQSGWRLLNTPSVIEAIRAARQRLYQTDLANVAVSTLHQVI